MTHMTLPESIQTLLVNDGINFVAAIVTLVIGWFLSRQIAGWVRLLLNRMPHFDATLKPLIVSVVRYAILIVTLIAVLERFGVETTSLIAVLGAAGIAIGLALQGTLSNVASGVMLLLLRPFQVGDYVVVGSNIGGTVREIGLFTTVLIDPDMMFISVPNSQIFGGAITNYSREATRRVNIVVGIDYADDIGKAQAVLLDIMKSDPRVLASPAPTTPVNDLGASSVNLVARCFVANAVYWDVMSDMQKAIKLRLEAAGISIPYPQQTVSERKSPAASAPQNPA